MCSGTKQSELRSTLCLFQANYGRQLTHERIVYTVLYVLCHVLGSLLLVLGSIVVVVVVVVPCFRSRSRARFRPRRDDGMKLT